MVVGVNCGKMLWLSMQGMQREGDGFGVATPLEQRELPRATLVNVPKDKKHRVTLEVYKKQWHEDVAPSEREMLASSLAST